MSALLQFSNVRYAVIRLSSAKGSPERLVLAYPNEETLRGFIADTSIVGPGFSSRDEAACAAGAAVTKGATPWQADEEQVLTPKRGWCTAFESNWHIE
jgi:hypothetical protein